MVDEHVNDGTARVRVMQRLTVSPSEDLGYLVEDPITNRYYRVGPREFVVIDELTEYTEPSAAFLRANARLGDDPFSETEFAGVLEWLHSEQLLDHEQVAAPAAQPQRRDPARWLNLITFRIPLGNPDRLLGRIEPKLRFVTGRRFFALWVLVCASAILAVAFQWPRFSTAGNGIFYPGNWLSLLAVWAVIKILHELFHGLVCKRYGGHVYEVGIIAILFIPIGYVDATTSWRFARRGQRIFTALAGMYVELFCAGIAAWVWTLTAPGIVNDLAYQTVILASVTTLLFNANPLMRFDGYFALADISRTPNLYAHGRRYVSYLMRRYVLGEAVTFDTHGLRSPLFVKIYGAAALVWRTTVIVTLLIAANALFYGAGVVIAAGAFIAMFVLPSWRNLRSLAARLDPRARALAAARLAVLVTIVAITGAFVSWRPDVVAPAVVDFADRHVFRAESPGFVERVHIRSGERVGSGTLLVSLSNRELEQQLQTLALDLAQAEIRLRIHRNSGRAADAQREQENLNQLQRLHAAAAEDVAALRIRAPTAGIVFSPSLHTLPGRYLQRGDAFAELIGSNRKEIHISLAENVMNDVSIAPGDSVALRIPRLPRGSLDGTVVSIDPTLRRRIDYAALAATNGGPLSVRAGVAEAARNDDANYEFLAPRGSVTAMLGSSTDTTLFAGELGYAKLRGRSMSLATHVATRIEDWVTRLVRGNAAT